MSEQLSTNVVIHKEKVGDKEMYVAECEELSISDFGETPEEAIINLKKALQLLISVEPEKAIPLKKEEPLLTTKLYL